MLDPADRRVVRVRGSFRDCALCGECGEWPCVVCGACPTAYCVLCVSPFGVCKVWEARIVCLCGPSSVEVDVLRVAPHVPLWSMRIVVTDVTWASERNRSTDRAETRKITTLSLSI